MGQLSSTLSAWSESLSQMWLHFFPRWGDREYKIVMGERLGALGTAVSGCCCERMLCGRAELQHGVPGPPPGSPLVPPKPPPALTPPPSPPPRPPAPPRSGAGQRGQDDDPLPPAPGRGGAHGAHHRLQRGAGQGGQAHHVRPAGCRGRAAGNQLPRQRRRTAHAGGLSKRLLGSITASRSSGARPRRARLRPA